MRRWVASLRELGKQANTVSKHIDEFAKNYEYARTEVNAIADESERAQAKDAAEQKPFDGSRYAEEANAVLRDHYNPSLTHADTKSVEIPVPIRAFHRDDTARLPDPLKSAFVTPNGVFDVPLITASTDSVACARAAGCATPRHEGHSRGHPAGRYTPGRDQTQHC